MRDDYIEIFCTELNLQGEKKVYTGSLGGEEKTSQVRSSLSLVLLEPFIKHIPANTVSSLQYILKDTLNMKNYQI